MNIKKILVYFFVTLGIIFFVLILSGAYLWIVDPFEIRPLLNSNSTALQTDAKVKSATSSDEKNVAAQNSEIKLEAKAAAAPLTPAQKDALNLVGIDSNLIPSELTLEQKSCFIKQIGQDRVDEIIAGAVPSIIEIFKGKDCLK